MKRKLPQVAALPHDAPAIEEPTPEHLLPEKPEGCSRLVISRKPQQSLVIDCNGVQVQITLVEIQRQGTTGNRGTTRRAHSAVRVAGGCIWSAMREWPQR